MCRDVPEMCHQYIFKIKTGLVKIICFSRQFDLKNDLTISLSQIRHHYTLLMFNG